MFRRGAVVSLVVVSLVACAPMAAPLSPDLPTLAPTIAPPTHVGTATRPPSPTYTPLSLMGQASSETPRPVVSSTPSPLDVSPVDALSADEAWRFIAMRSVVALVMQERALELQAGERESWEVASAFDYANSDLLESDGTDDSTRFPDFARSLYPEWDRIRSGVRDVVQQALPLATIYDPMGLSPTELVTELEPFASASAQNLEAIIQAFAAHSDRTAAEYTEMAEAMRQFLLWETDLGDEPLPEAVSTLLTP